MNIIDKSTGSIIGSVMTNRSLTLDEAFDLAGFRWRTLAGDGVECDGWYDADDTLWDESVAEMDY